MITMISGVSTGILAGIYISSIVIFFVFYLFNQPECKDVSILQEMFPVLFPTKYTKIGLLTLYPILLLILGPMALSMIITKLLIDIVGFVLIRTILIRTNRITKIIARSIHNVFFKNKLTGV